MSVKKNFNCKIFVFDNSFIGVFLSVYIVFYCIYTIKII